MRFGDVAAVEVTKAQVRTQDDAERIREAAQRMHFHEQVVGEGTGRWMSHCHDDDEIDHVHPGRQAFPGHADGGYWEELGPSIGKSTPAPVAANLVRVAESMLLRPPTPGRDLMRWRLRLFCGHVAERTAHRSHLTARAAFTLSRCEECGLDPATIVAAEPLGLVEPPIPNTPDPPDVVDGERARIEARLTALRDEVTSLERRLAEKDSAT